MNNKSIILIIFSLLTPGINIAQATTEYPFDNLIINAENVVKFEAFASSDKIYFKWMQYKDSIPGVYVIQKIKDEGTEIVLFQENVMTKKNIPILFTAQTSLTSKTDKFILTKVPYPDNILLQIENNENAVINPVMVDNKIHFIVVNQHKKKPIHDEN